MRWRIFLAAAGVLAAAPVLAQLPAVRPGNVPEPAGLYQGAMHGYVPNAIKGGTVLDSPAFVALMSAKHPLLIDVADKDRKPPTMAKDTPWLPQHRSIPGAVWLQGAGNATGDPAFDAAFRSRFAALAGDDRARPIVVFCHPDCWASYNAAKRLVVLGYSAVYWYPEGMEGWQDAHDTSVIKPDAAWSASLSKALTQ